MEEMNARLDAEAVMLWAAAAMLAGANALIASFEDPAVVPLYLAAFALCACMSLWTRMTRRRVH